MIDWLQYATTFDLGMSSMYDRPVQIQSYEQVDGSLKWAVKMHEWVLGKDNHWYWQPNPSGRNEEFIQTCRYDSKEEAYDQFLDHIDKGEIHTLYVCNVSEVKQ